MKRVQGLVLLVLLSYLSVLKTRTGVLPEMLWICHVSALTLALGLLFDVRLMCAIGFLYHLGVGLPTYLLHVATGGDTTWVSFLIHALTPLFGWFAFRMTPLPRATPWSAFALFLAAVAASRVLTPVQMNVNLAFRPWAPLNFLGTVPAFALNLTLMLATLLLVHALFNRLAGSHARAPGRRVSLPDTSTGSAASD